jgi:hypothetical protein
MTSLDLAHVLRAEQLEPASLALPVSGALVSIPRFLRVEERSKGAIPRTPKCWAPNKPALLFDGTVTWAEYVLVRLLEHAGWEGRWIKNWTGGREMCVDLDLPRAMPAGPGRVFDALHKRAAQLRGAGSWDVFAWSGDEYLFLESKQHRSSDRLNPNQLAWLESAIDEGFTPEQFAIVEYDAGQPDRATPRASRVRAASVAPDGLVELLARVRTLDRGQRIESRAAVVEFGADAIRPMAEWLDDDELRRFAIGVLEVIGRSDGRATTNLNKYAKGGGADADLATAAYERLRATAAGGRTRSSNAPVGDVYIATGKPPPAQGPCGIPNPDGSPCNNPGRWPVSGVWSCTTHYKAYTRRGGTL